MIASDLDPSAPVIVTGMARSGSSLLCLILNQAAGGLVINDAYPAQMAEDLGAPGPLSPPPGPGGTRNARDARLQAMARFRAAARARIERRSWTRAGPAPIHRPTRLTPGMRAALDAARGPDWARLWGAMLHAAAQADARPFWGWNAAPDHLRAAEILSAFPRARFLFALRCPWAMLRSYAALPEGWGRERARYHPYLQARAWAAAMRGHDRLAQALPGRVHLLRHEDLLADPEASLAALAAFLGRPPFAADPGALPANASDPGPGLSRAEIAAARRGLGAMAARAGPPPAPQGAGLGRLARLSLRAGSYYAGEMARSADMRGRVRRLMRA